MKKLIIALVLALGMTGCATGTPEPAPTVTVTETRPEESAPEPKDRSGHDWDSVQAYEEDMIDSTDSVSQLLDMWADAFSGWVNGTYSDRELIELNETFREVLASHRDHFIGTTPPAEYENIQRKIVGGWSKYDEAAMLVTQALRTGSNGYLEDALMVMEEGNDLIVDALDELEASYYGTI